MVDTQFGVYRDPLGKTWTVGVSGSVYVRENTDWKSVLAYTRTLSDLKDVWIFSDKEGWAVGQNGAILRFDGDRFHCQYLDPDQKPVYWSPTKNDLHAIWANNDRDVWVVGSEEIVHFDGQKWDVVTSSPGPLYAIARRPDGRLIAGGRWGSAARAEPLIMVYEANKWNSIRLPTGLRAEIRDIGVGPSQHVFAVGHKLDESGESEGGFVLIEEDGSWRVLSSNLKAGLNAVEVDANGRIWFAGKGGLLGYVANQEVVEVSPILGDGDIHALDANQAVIDVVGDDGLVGTFDGMWHLNRLQIPRTSTQPELTVWERNQNDVWAGGDGFVMHYTGTTWSVAPIQAEIVGFYGVAFDHVYAAGNAAEGFGVVYRFDGQQFEEVQRVQAKVVQISGAGSTDVRIDLDDTNILHFDGDRWQQRQRSAFERSLSSSANQSSWTLGRQGFGRDNDDPCQTTIWPFDGLQQTPRAAWGTAADNIWAAGDDGIVHFDGVNWRKLSGGVSIRAISGQGSNNVWFAGCDRGQAALWNWNQHELVPIDTSDIDEECLTDVSLDSQGRVYTTGHNLYRYDRGIWQRLYSFSNRLFTSVVAFSEDQIWCASGNSIHHYDQGFWTVYQTPDLLNLIPLSGNSNVLIEQIFPLNQDLIFFRGGTDDKTAAVLLVYDQGEWSNRTLESWDSEASFTYLWGTSPDHIYVTMGQLGYLYRYQHAVRFFTEVWAPIAQPLTAIWGITENEIWLFGQAGAILTNFGIGSKSRSN